MKKYDDKVAIKNINLTVKDGSIFGIVGHNGAAKTTIIKSIVGLHTFDKGHIIINGKDLEKNRNEIKKRNCLCTRQS